MRCYTRTSACVPQFIRLPLLVPHFTVSIPCPDTSNHGSDGEMAVPRFMSRLKAESVTSLLVARADIDTTGNSFLLHLSKPIADMNVIGATALHQARCIAEVVQIIHSLGNMQCESSALIWNMIVHWPSDTQLGWCLTKYSLCSCFCSNY